MCGIEGGAVSSSANAEWLLPGQTAAPTPPGGYVCDFKHDCSKCTSYCGNSMQCTATQCICPNDPSRNCRWPSAPPPHTAPPGEVRYHCDEATHKCVEQATGHSTIEKCQAACA